MLTLVTGQPGNGKTLRAMALMEEEHDRNAKAVKEGREQPRRFFTNIAGATTEENPEAFPWVEKLPEHRDWTQLPDCSYVIYDEAHSDGNTTGLERYGLLFPATGKPGESHDPRIRAMSTHRHRGFDLVLITQWPSKVHHQVRSLVGKHFHMNRSMGLAAAGVLTWSRVQVDPYDETQREKAEEEIWKYPKDLYRRYKSATLHTASHKFRVPKKLKDGLITFATIVVMAVVAGWALGWYKPMMSAMGWGGAPEAQSGSAAAPAPQGSLFSSLPRGEDGAPGLIPGMGTHRHLNTEPAPTLAGCAASDRGCRCFNSEGFEIDMSVSECRRTLAAPLPFNVLHEYKQQQNREVEADRSKQPLEHSGSLAGSTVEGDPAHVQGAGVAL